MSDMALIMYFFKRASPTADADMIGLGEEEIGVLGGWVFSGVTSRFLWLVGFKYPAFIVSIWFLLELVVRKRSF